MKYYRKIIKIGNSRGVTIPKENCPFDLDVGDICEIIVKKVR